VENQIFERDYRLTDEETVKASKKGKCAKRQGYYDNLLHRLDAYAKRVCGKITRCGL